jgi:3-methyladenine DNA glycosylase AlkD
MKDIINEMKVLAKPASAAFMMKMLTLNEDSERKVLGCTMPQLRTISKKYVESVTFDDIDTMTKSNIEEFREIAVLMLMEKFNGDPQTVVKFYLDHIIYFDDWALVDTGCQKIIGNYFDSSDPVYDRLANDSNLWANRIAVVSTISYIKKGDFNLTLRLVEKFLHHSSHFIHKACGWMLREVGKKNQEVLIKFLKKHSTSMPRVMLSYSVERLPPKVRSSFMSQNKQKKAK